MSNVVPISAGMVTLDNAIVRGSQSLTAIEIDLLHIILSRVQVSDEPLKTYEIDKKTLIGLLGLEKSGSVYSEVRNALEVLQSHVINLKAGQGKSYLNVNVVSMVENLEGSPVIRWQLHPKLSSYILNLKGNFTTYELTLFLRLKSVYSKRLYMYLRSYSAGYSITVKIEELHEILQLPDSLRALYGNLKNRVIKPSIDELIHTDRPFLFTENYKGKKVESITFKLLPRENVKSLKNGESATPIIYSQLNLLFSDHPAHVYIQALVNRGMTAKQAEIAVMQLGEKGVNRVLNRFKEYSLKPGNVIKSPAAYLVSICKSEGVIFNAPIETKAA